MAAIVLFYLEKIGTMDSLLCHSRKLKIILKQLDCLAPLVGLTIRLIGVCFF